MTDLDVISLVDEGLGNSSYLLDLGDHRAERLVQGDSEYLVAGSLRLPACLLRREIQDDPLPPI